LLLSNLFPSILQPTTIFKYYHFFKVLLITHHLPQQFVLERYDPPHLTNLAFIHPYHQLNEQEVLIVLRLQLPQLPSRPLLIITPKKQCQTKSEIDS
jgi:hypothetical protein